MVLENEIEVVYVPKQRETVRLRLKQLDPKFLGKWKKNNWHSNNFSTIGRKLTIPGYKWGNLTYFQNV